MLRRQPKSLLLLAVLGAGLLLTGGDGVASAASSGTVVGVTVPSAIWLSDQCTDPAAHEFGLVLPGSPALTATGAGVCRYSFSSSNSSSMLRMYQADTTGDAMVGHPTSWSTLGGTGLPNAWDISGSGNLVHATRDDGAVDDYAWSADGGSTWSTGSTGSSKYRSVSVASGTVAWRVRAGGAIRTNNAADVPGPPAWNAVTNAVVGADPDWNAIDNVDAVSYATAWIVNGTHVYRTTNPVAAEPWEHTSSGCSNADEIDALDASTAFTNGSGRICRTTNGGAVWTPLTNNIPSGVWVTDVAISPQTSTVIWAGLEDGTVLRSTNNGTNWTAVTALPVPGRVETIQAVSDSEIYVGAEDGFVFRTTTTGASWTRIRTRVTTNVTELYAASASTIVHNTGDGVIWGTGDGGTTWSKQLGSGSEDTPQDVDAVNDDVIVAAKGDGNVVVTTNGGSSFTTRATGMSPDNVRGVAVVDDTTFVAVGDRGKVAITTDAGATWTARASGTTEDLWDVDVAPDGVAIAVGAGGTILRSTDFGWNWTVRASSGNDLRRVSVHPSGLVLAVGIGGAIRRSTDAGLAWTTPASGTTRNIASVQTPLATVAYATVSGALLKSVDGGATWSSIAMASSDLLAMAAVNENVIYAARLGSYRTGYTVWLRRSDDGGATWSTPFTNHYGRVRAIHAIDGGRIVLGSQGGWMRVTGPSAGVPDYGGGATWASGGAFGVCVQALGGGATAGAWTVDATGTPNHCEATDTDPWNAVPTAPVKVAQMTVAGTGSADVVWGMRPTSGAAPSTYTAGVVVEAVAPNL